MKNFKKGPARNAFSIADAGGFTLIELLIVVAIIGILASVVLNSLNKARAKGINAAIKGTLSGARAQAELYFEENKTYTGICASNANAIGPIILSAAQKLGLEATVENSGGFSYNSNGLSTNIGDALCKDKATAWIAIISLKPPTSVLNSGWCIDNTGIAKEIVTLSPISYICQ